ncbi:MAG TPA: hypothetical protein VFW45_05160 [Candidatus Polarisedimenticolia bacterium]|nr:hypothetical protein [Candidatus Polarisedimenticolia bacterium]
MRAKRSSAMLLLVALIGGLAGVLPAHAAIPPGTVNYQGVLRDQNDVPLSGTYDMVFRFWDDPAAGNEILVDTHTAALGGAITVANGLFSVALGSGNVTDGSGPGTFTSLTAVFRDNGSVWLEIQVGAETLSPRTRFHSSAFSLNSTYLDGNPGSYYIDTSSFPQEKDGELDLINNAGGLALDAESLGTAIYAYGANGYALLAESVGGEAGHFIGSVSASCGMGGCRAVSGVGAPGFGTGVYGSGLIGVNGTGNTGGRFAYSGGGTFPALADISTSTAGISTTGGDFGGNFTTGKPGSTGVFAFAANKGVDAIGGLIGVNASSSGGTGVSGSGGTFGGSFTGTGAGSIGVYGSGTDKGIRGDGGNYGAYFQATGPGSYGLHADGVHTGVEASGQTRGAYFSDTAGDNATLAGNGLGISASSTGNIGSYFSNGSPFFGYTQIPYYDVGVLSYGSNAGGWFQAFSTGLHGVVAFSSYKIMGNGAVSFVQNHPTDPSKVIVYVAPEGDEAAVYTRGSGKLVNGIARVKLGETFAMVANPDIGLTATTTPRGEPIALAVSDVSPTELVVRGPAGSSAEFDYMVWGLRIGFEEQSIVQPKKEDSKIPSMHFHEEFFKEDPTLRKYTALERFKGVEESVHGKKTLDLARADHLREAVGVSPYHEPSEMAHDPKRLAALAVAAGPKPEAAPAQASSPDALKGSGAAQSPTTEPSLTQETLPAVRPTPPVLDLFTREGALEAGDVVGLDPNAPGSVRRSNGASDALAIGCVQPTDVASGDSGQLPPVGPVAVATSHVALCRVDASYGAIAVGDHLSLSPQPGLAMRVDPGIPAAIPLGRAIDPLPSGVGMIRVLLGGI